MTSRRTFISQLAAAPLVGGVAVIERFGTVPSIDDLLSGA